jgi:hypothetical protein
VLADALEITPDVCPDSINSVALSAKSTPADASLAAGP